MIVNDSAIDLGPAAAAPMIQLVVRHAVDEALENGSIDEFYVIPATWPASAEVHRVEGSGSFSLDAAQRHEIQAGSWQSPCGPACCRALASAPTRWPGSIRPRVYPRSP